MMRSDIHSAFVKRFSRPRRKPITPVSGDDIFSAEKEVGTIFPASFVAFIASHGPVYTPEILDLVVDAQESGPSDFEGWDVADFIALAEIPKTHAMYAKGGMDDSVVPFASDSSGNIFGFRRTTSDNRLDDAPVLFFDHDFCKVSIEADSFDGWLERFLQL
jgi:hypothetical protein